MNGEQFLAAHPHALALVRAVYSLKAHADRLAVIPDDDRKLARNPHHAGYYPGGPEVAERTRALIDQFGKSLVALCDQFKESQNSIESALPLIEADLPRDQGAAFQFGNRLDFTATESVFRTAEEIVGIAHDETLPPEHAAAEKRVHALILPDQKLTIAAIRDEFRRLSSKLDEGKQQVSVTQSESPEVTTEIKAASGENDRWMSFAEADRLTGINRGQFCRAADRQEIIDNGLKGRKRKIDRADVTRWAEEYRKNQQS
jgi:hypothetical protein